MKRYLLECIVQPIVVVLRDDGGISKQVAPPMAVPADDLANFCSELIRIAGEPMTSELPAESNTPGK